MGRLEFKRTKVLYLAFLLVIPDFTVYARLSKKLAQDDAAANLAKEEYIREIIAHDVDLVDVFEGKNAHDATDGMVNKRTEEHGDADRMTQSTRLALSPPKEKRWVSAIVTGTMLAADLACLATIAANMGCGGLQKTICRLRKEVQQRHDRLDQEVKQTQGLEQTYDNKRDKALQASNYNEYILRKIRDSIDIAEKYLKLLAKVEQFLKGLPVLPAGFYTLDTRINSFIIDFEKVPDTSSSPVDLTAALIVLGLELLPYVGKAMYRTVSKMRYPKAGDFDFTMKKNGKLYGVKGNGVFEINSKLKPTRRASFKEVNHFKQTQSYSKVRTTTGKTFSSTLSKVGRAAGIGLGLVGIALCGWQIYEMNKKNKEAEAKLKEQKKSLDNFIVDVDDSQAVMQGLIDNATDLIGDYGNNFRVLTETLVASKTFKLVATQSERDRIMTVNGTATTESNLLDQQKAVYDFVIKYYEHMRNEYQNLVKIQQVTLDVEDSVGVDLIKRKLEGLGMTVNGKLEIFQIIARVYTNKAMYDGIDLNCIRNGKIKTEADLNKKNEGPVVSQDVAGQIQMLATLAMVPPGDIAMIVNARYKIALTNDQILAVVARETKDASFADRNGIKYDLTKYRKSSAC